MVGFTWHGRGAPDPDPPGRLRHLARLEHMRFQHDGPDLDSGEGDPDLRPTEPLWVGADGTLEVSTQRRGPPAAMALIDPGVCRPARAGPRRLRTHGRVAATGASASCRAVGCRRALARRGDYNHAMQQVHVHHTANGNGYSRDDVPALIRGMYRYHTLTLGWSDIGYNFLVDRFGRTWAGRHGGAGRRCGARTPWASTTPRPGSR